MTIENYTNYINLLKETPKDQYTDVLFLYEKNTIGKRLLFKHLGYDIKNKNILFYKPNENNKMFDNTLNNWKRIYDVDNSISEDEFNKILMSKDNVINKIIVFRENNKDYSFLKFSIFIINLNKIENNNLEWSILFEHTIDNENDFNKMFKTNLIIKETDVNFKNETLESQQKIKDIIKKINTITNNNSNKLKNIHNKGFEENKLTNQKISINNISYTVQHNYYYEDNIKDLLIDIFRKKQVELINKEIELLNNNKNKIIYELLNNDIQFNNLLIELEKNNQLIIYGTAGLGKSHSIKELIDKKENPNDYTTFRTVFHPEFSYYDFVGKILPITKEDNSIISEDQPITKKNKYITYEFQDGIFTKAYKEAITCPNKNVYLIIDEINRGYTTGIFGDIFLLLDRKNNESEYNIEWTGLQGESIKKCTITNQKNDYTLKLPKNLYIIGTMNTSDKTTIKLDKAFERRFNKYFISLKDSIENMEKYTIENEQKIVYKNFLINLNNKIKQDLSSNVEDIDNELIGPYFIKANNDIIAKSDIQYSLMYHLWYSTYADNRILLKKDEIKSFEDFISIGYESFIESIINYKESK